MTAALPAGCPFLNTWFPFCRATPWQAGELVTHYPVYSSRPAGPARLLAVRGNLAFGVFQADSAQLPAGALARTDSALQVMAQRGVPLLQSAFGLAAPTTTSDESGQLYLMLEASSSPGGASWYADPGTGHGRWGRLTFGLSPNSAFGFAQASYANPLIILAHEVLHTYQFRWRYQFASPWLTYLGTGWGVEGAATFYSIEMVREATGTPFLGNIQLPAVATNDPRSILALYSNRVGDFPFGYSNASGFLRDLTQRLVTSGLPFDAAMREVLTGAMEGWYGINEEGQARGLGLTARMRARLGASWNPNDALLDWTMSEAADDQTPNPRFQNLTVRMAQPSPANSPFPPHAVIGPGASTTVRRHPGTSGVFEVRDDVGGSYRAGADVKGVPLSRVEWLLLRVR